MIEIDFAIKFADEWISAFNSHNLETIFDLYNENFSMTSPFIIERMGIESGTLHGKDEIRPYWQAALNQQPPLRFELINVFSGVNSVSILYQSIGRKLVLETFTFNNHGKVISGCSQHASHT